MIRLLIAQYFLKCSALLVTILRRTDYLEQMPRGSAEEGHTKPKFLHIVRFADDGYAETFQLSNAGPRT
jgi:hypothetical protein